MLYIYYFLIKRKKLFGRPNIIYYVAAIIKLLLIQVNLDL